MAWQDESIIILRALINDMDATAFTDDRLEMVLAVAGRQILVDLDFSQAFTVTIGDTMAITPDPTDVATRDDSFINLMTLKAACIVNHGAALLAAKQAIGVADGSSKIDLRERGAALARLLEKGWCAVYEQAKYEFQSGSSGVAGAIVMTPFRLFAQGSSMWGSPASDRWGRTNTW